jgi:hypothetical protein
MKDRGITLIPGTLGGDAVARAWLPTLAIVGVVFTALLIGGTWFFLGSRIAGEQAVVSALETRRAALLEQANVAEEDLRAYRATVRRATALRDLLAQHRVWGPFFQLIEARTLPSVRYESVTADVSGNTTLPATAPSVRAAAEQLVAWQQANGVRGIEMSGLSSTTDELGVIRSTRFDLRFQVDPSVFTTHSF